MPRHFSLLRSFVLTLSVVLAIQSAAVSLPAQDDAAAKLTDEQLGSTRNVHGFGRNLLCGQPSAADFADAKKRGIKVVVTLRTEAEADGDEVRVLKELGLEFHRFGFSSPEGLTDDIFDGTLKVLADSKQTPTMLHCASANRVGALWLAHRVLNDGVSVDAARAEAATVGLRTPALEEKALDYIKRRQAEPKSVKPGINTTFLDPKLDVSDWIGRFEVESREVYSSRIDVVKACDIQPGSRIADIGAGTGLFSRLFADAVGNDGEVFAVGISPKFIEHIELRSREDKLRNLSTVLCTDRSTKLPEASVDAAFICDTYHHFEYPQLTMASLHQAIKPGGTLIVIDFERIPGQSREFILGHVRAGKDVFKSEIEAAGFEAIEEVTIPGFKENYFLRFRRVDAAPGR